MRKVIREKGKVQGLPVFIQTYHEKVSNKHNWHEDYDKHIVKEGKPFSHSIMQTCAVFLNTK